MKKIIKLLVVLALCYTTSTVGQESTKEVDSLNIEIGNVLKDIPFDVEKDVNAKALIKFNKENKIVNVKVICNDFTMAKFIKARLMGATIKGRGFSLGKVYSLPIKVISKQK